MRYEHIIIAGLEVARTIAQEVRDPEHSIHAEAIEHDHQGQPYSVVSYICEPRAQIKVLMQIDDIAHRLTDEA